MKNPQPKLLLVRLSSIGDIVLTTPVLRCLKTQFPQFELHYLTKVQFAGIVTPNPYVSRVHIWQNNARQTAAVLASENFDYVIDLHHNLRTLGLKTALRVPAHSFNKINIEKWLMVRFKWNLLPNKHIVDRYLETVSFLGVKNDGCGLDFFISPDDEVQIPDMFPQIGRQPFIALAVGAAHATKKLPLKKLLTVCELIKQPLILLGGREDAETGEQIARRFSRQVVNACGQLRLGQSASVIKQAAKVISPDTGLMHIAAAFNKPIMSIWGNTIPQFGMYPYLPANTQNPFTLAEVKGLPCRPCSKIGYETCPKKHFRCMEMINENDIADWANAI